MKNTSYYTKTGKGIPLVFQHGLGADSRQVTKLFKELPDIEVICMDCPGHGQSPLSSALHLSFDYYSDELLAILADLGIEKAYFGGISMGSGIALNIALRYPEKVSGLVLVRPAWLDQINPKNLSILKEAARHLREQNIEGFKSSAGYNQIDSKFPNAGASLLGLFEPTQQSQLPIVLESMVQDSPLTNLNELEVINRPCLIIGNQNDPLHPFEMAETIHQWIRNSQLAEVTSRYVDETAHSNIVNQLISKFILSNEE